MRLGDLVLLSVRPPPIKTILSALGMPTRQMRLVSRVEYNRSYAGATYSSQHEVRAYTSILKCAVGIRPEVTKVVVDINTSPNLRSTGGRFVTEVVSSGRAYVRQGAGSWHPRKCIGCLQCLFKWFG